MSPRRRLLLLVIAAVVAVAAVLVVVRVVRSAGPTLAEGPPAQDRLGPVLLVPGYGGDTGSLSALAARIMAGGRSAQVVALPGDGTGDLIAQVAVLSSAVDKALSAGAPSVDLVGYSAGGVVVGLWLARDQGARKARRVVTLGSPLHGASVAGVGAALLPDACPQACRQLAPGSSLLAELDRAAVGSQVPWLSVWTTQDQTVQPPDSARLAGAVDVAVQNVCADEVVGHGDLPTDPAVTGLVLRALGTAPIAAPGPPDCAALRAEGAV